MTAEEYQDNRLSEDVYTCEHGVPWDELCHGGDCFRDRDAPADPNAMETLRRTMLRTCTDGELHDWESGGAFGVIVGLSRCRKCQTLSRAEHFEKAETTCDPLSLEPIHAKVRRPMKP